MRAFAPLVLITACVVQPADSTTPAPGPGPVADYAAKSHSVTGSALEQIPFQRWPDVPSYVVGILYEAGAQPWGGSVGHMRNAHTSSGRNEYKFSFDGSSPYALYFASDGRGENYLTGWGVPLPNQQYEQYDAAMFGAAVQDEWGLDRKAHLVELEVNNGKGGRGLHFVVTDARVLDGTDDFPMDPVAVLVSLRRSFDREIDARRDDLNAKMAASKQRAEQAVVGKRDPEKTMPEAQVAMWPSWHREDRKLSVTFVYLAGGVINETIPAEHVKHPDCPPGAPCVDWGPPQPQPASHAYGVEMGATFDVDASGAITAATIYEPRAR